jgi:hypothetical protein
MSIRARYVPLSVQQAMFSPSPMRPSDLFVYICQAIPKLLRLNPKGNFSLPKATESECSESIGIPSSFSGQTQKTKKNSKLHIVATFQKRDGHVSDRRALANSRLSDCIPLQLQGPGKKKLPDAENNSWHE